MLIDGDLVGKHYTFLLSTCFPTCRTRWPARSTNEFSKIGDRSPGAWPPPGTLCFCLEAAHDLDLIIEEFDIWPGCGYVVDNLIDHCPGLFAVGSHAGNGKGQALPRVPVHAGVLSHRYVETPANSLGQAASGLSSSLQTVTVSNPEADLGDCYMHVVQGAERRALRESPTGQTRTSRSVDVWSGVRAVFWGTDALQTARVAPVLTVGIGRDRLCSFSTWTRSEVMIEPAYVI